MGALELAGAVAEGDAADGLVEAAALLGEEAAPLEEGPELGEPDPEAELLDPLPTQLVVAT